MKLFKNPIFMFILGIIISGSVVYAVTTLTADEVEYDTNTTVKEKLDDLYTAATNTISELNNQLSTYKTKFDRFTFGIGVSPKAANVAGTAQSSLGYWQQRYKYVTITISQSSNATCKAYFNDNNWSVQTDIPFNTKTSIENHDWLYLQSNTTAVNGVCNFNLTFSNN